MFLKSSYETPNPAIFDDDNFEEALRFLEFELSLTGVDELPESTPAQHRNRPTLHFVGKISGNASVRGRVYMTPDDQVRWTFVCSCFYFGV